MSQNKRNKNRCCELLKDTSLIYVDKSLILDGRFKYVPWWAILLSLAFISIVSYYVFNIYTLFGTVYNFDEFV